LHVSISIKPADHFIQNCIHFFTYITVTPPNTRRIRSRCRPLATAGKVSAAEVTDQRRDFFVSNFSPLFTFMVPY